MTVDLEILAKHRNDLLLAEVAAWLHNIGKMDPNFLVMQTGESPDILDIYRVAQYSFRRFADPSVLLGNSPYTQQKGVLYFVNEQLRRKVLQIKKKIEYINTLLSDQSTSPEERKRLANKLRTWQEEKDRNKKQLKSEEQNQWENYEKQIEQCKIPSVGNWPLGSLLTMFWESEWFDKPQASGYEPGSDNDPDYQRKPKPGISLRPGFTMDLPALLLLAHGEVSGQEKKGMDAQGRYVGIDDYQQQPPLSLDKIRIASAFGHETEHPLAWHTWMNQRKQIFDWLLSSWNNPLQLKAEMLQQFAPLRNALGDTQRPINEISLWDYSWAVAALFKTAVARAVITGNVPTPADMHWRLVSVRLDALDFLSHSNQIADLIARRQLLKDFYQMIQHLLEVEIPIGASVYNDENGLVFVMPEIPGWTNTELQAALLSLIHNALDNPQSLQTVDFSGLYGAADLRPCVQVGSAQRGKKLQLQEVLPQAEPLSTPNPDHMEKWWKEATKERCAICGLRPQGYVEPGLPSFVTADKARKRRLCGICLARRGRRSEDWAKRRQNETIWIDEIADVNGRLAIVVGRFELDEWLVGILVSSIAMGTDQHGNWLVKPPTFARIQRVWRTTAQFWQDVNQQVCSQSQDDRRRLILQLNKQPDLGDYHTYELDLGPTSMSVVWIPSHGDQGAHLISVDNLQYVARQLGAEENIYRDPVLSCIFVEDFVREKFIQNGLEPILRNPEGEGLAREENLLRGYKFVETKHQDVSFSTAIPILAEPRTFMALVPADRALPIVQAIKCKYEREMGKVRNRLPLTLGVVYFGRRTPLAAALDAGRRMLRRKVTAGTWTVKSRDPLECLSDDWPRRVCLTLSDGFRSIQVEIPTVMGDNETKDVWYPYWRLEGDNITNRQRWFKGADGGIWVHVCDLRPGDRVHFMPSTFDYEYLDTTTRRFEIFYGEDGQRRGNEKPQRPYLLEELSDIQNVWKALQSLRRSQIYQIESLIEAKRRAWGNRRGRAALDLPSEDVFRRFVKDVLLEAQAYSQLLEKAALNGMLSDVLELYFTLGTKEAEHDQR
ncbi:MAG: hypothetical protein WHS87_11420 [Anaerolineales bacterium]